MRLSNSHPIAYTHRSHFHTLPGTVEVVEAWVFQVEMAKLSRKLRPILAQRRLTPSVHKPKNPTLSLSI